MQDIANRLAEIKLDCGDNSCLFAVTKGGMRTNGGCRCLQDLTHDQQRKVRWYFMALRSKLKQLEQRVTELESQKHEPQAPPA